jgi:hypothetical protein
MSALMNHRVSAVNSREGDISRWGTGGRGVVRRKAVWVMRTGSLWRVSFPKTHCVACWTKRMDSLKARLAWLACLA